MTTRLVAPAATVPLPGHGREPIVKIQHLTKRFALRRGWAQTLLHPRTPHFVEVLCNISLDIVPGELFGLLGPNGAGKTTLFKILSTLIIPDGGTAQVAGCDLLREASRVRRVLTPVIVDERSLNWRVSAEENLRLYGSLHGLRGPELKARINELLSVVGLQETGDQMAGQFSAGMRQRLLIARALLSRPRVLLLDEPTRSLDPISARKFRSFLRESIVGRQGCTVLLATHTPEEALELCDRVAILDRGKLIAVGSPQSLAGAMMGEYYRVWTTTPRHAAFRALIADDRVSNLVPVGNPTDCGVFELRLHGGADAAAAILRSLVMRGVQISRFEQTPTTLADLIEHTIRKAESHDSRA